MRLILLPLLLAVAGCGDARVEFPKPPADKLVCGKEPAVPEGKGPGGAITDEQNGEYLKALRNWGVGCWGDVEWLAVWFADLGKKK